MALVVSSYRMGGPDHRLDDVYFYFSSSSTRMSPLYLLVNGQDLRLDYTVVYTVYIQLLLSVYGASKSNPTASYL